MGRSGMDDFTAAVQIELTNPEGLHARPTVKLVQLAKTFNADIQLSPSLDGAWVDAKSIVRVMAVKAATGVTLHFRAKGSDAGAAVAALRDLVALNFGVDEADAVRSQIENSHG